jgi:succinate-acetate transporter protein
VLALNLITFAVVIALLGVSASRGQRLLAVILLTSTVRTTIAGVYELTANKAPLTAAGVIAVAIAAIALYGCVAFLLEDGANRTVLPLAPRGQAKTAPEAPIEDQVEGIGAEAGIRRAL